MDKSPIFVSIDVGKKRKSSVKKKRGAKADLPLPKGQLTLTQMPCMSPTPTVAAAAAGNSSPDSLSVDSPINLQKEKSEDMSPEPMEDIDVGELTVVPYTPKDPEENVIVFTIGDLVEMQHHVLDHYVQLGLVAKNHGSLVEVFWLWYARDGNNDLVCVPKKQTVNPDFLKRLAKFDEPMDPAQFNWWKYKGVTSHFAFYADGRGWRFKNMSW